MSSNGWKITAIIFICLFVLETAGFAFIIKIGTDVINNESKCSTDICYNIEGADSFIYEDPICYCYKNGEIIYQKYLN